jgi:hypothetical protein
MATQPTLSPQSYSEKITFYQTLSNRRQNIEAIFWSRVQTLHAIQVAVLGGAFYLWKIHSELGLAVAVLSLGIILTLTLGRLAYNDWKDTSINDCIMHKLGDELGITKSAHREDYFKSHNILFYLIILFFMLDIAFLLFLLVVR